LLNTLDVWNFFKCVCSNRAKMLRWWKLYLNKDDPLYIMQNTVWYVQFQIFIISLQREQSSYDVPARHLYHRTNLKTDVSVRTFAKWHWTQSTLADIFDLNPHYLIKKNNWLDGSQQIIIQIIFVEFEEKSGAPSEHLSGLEMFNVIKFLESNPLAIPC